MQNYALDLNNHVGHPTNDVRKWEPIRAVGKPTVRVKKLTAKAAGLIPGISPQ